MWDGFVMCCERLKAKSVSVLLELPESPLVKILHTAPDLNGYLATHLGNSIILCSRYILCDSITEH